MTTVASEIRNFPLSSLAAKRQAYFQLDGRPFAAIETKDGKIEIYWIHAKGRLRGLEMFQGYLGDKTVPAALAIAAVEALCPSSPAMRTRAKSRVFPSAYARG